MPEAIKNCLKSIINKLPLLNTVLFESAPDMSDNTKAVFDEMLRRGLNEKHKMVWIVKDPKSAPKIKNVRYMTPSDRRLSYLKRFARCVICCNEMPIGSHNKQVSFYLSHGTTIKKLSGYYTLPASISYCLSASSAVDFLCEQELKASREKIFSLGFPRNDVLVSAHRDLKPLFPECEFEKAVVWYPTFRQHKNGYTTGANNALPLIHDEEKATALNECAKQNKVLIVLKPHFAQDVSYVKNLNLDNIKFIDDSFFAQNGITSYEFVGSCDALITDYSSIYYDFTVCDKPIALVWEDYEEYKASPGFAEGVERFLSGGEKVYTLEDMQRFIENVAKGHDELAEERNNVCRQVNYAKDDQNSARVVDFIVEKAKL